eukprot:CAMPEP_0117519920 /NCGR_PEP_ID=MMETSP0784-20121206/32903_1 /TAXON_ID=39447 /ORGANISM="" /LENGTH=162 /DNA_ID=CAMNT_0005315901 /DNA_START=1 /DNA_END=489 /DNA_ORIENTATION=+
MMAAYNPMMMMMMMGSSGKGSTTSGGLAEFVKTGQRSSEQFKLAWQSYCGMYGGGRNDPMKHDESFVAGFIEYLGQLAEADLQNGGGGVKRPGPSLEPPAKRPAAGGDAEKAALVEKVKSLQRSDPEAKAEWWKFCDESAQGVKDPNRHEKDTLEVFLSGYV